MINAFLRCKNLWDKDLPDAALEQLNRVLADDSHPTTFYVPQSFIDHYRSSWFENAVIAILVDENRLLVPADAAFEKLYNLFPAQYLVNAAVDLGRALGPGAQDLLRDAAATGLLSCSSDDYDVSGRLVVTKDDHPELWELLGGDRLAGEVYRSGASHAKEDVFSKRPELLANLFLYAVFHRERPLNRDMVLIRLERMADSHREFLSSGADVMSRYLERPEEHEEIVKIGMRLEGIGDSSKCLHEFVETLRSRDFERFVMSTLPAGPD
jgi:hypothetical protein